MTSVTDTSELDPLASLVEVLEEVGLVLILDIVHEGVALVGSDGLVVGGGRDLVEEDGAPDVSILHIVESFVAFADEHVQLGWVSHLALLSPVSGELKLGLLWVCELTAACKIDKEWHVPAVLPEESQTLEVSLCD